jgi:hypothetical protein
MLGSTHRAKRSGLPGSTPGSGRGQGHGHGLGAAQGGRDLHAQNILDAKAHGSLTKMFAKAEFMAELEKAVKYALIADIEARFEKLHQAHKKIGNLVRIRSGRPGINLGDLQSSIDTSGLAETHVEKIIQALAQFLVHTTPTKCNFVHVTHVTPLWRISGIYSTPGQEFQRQTCSKA